MFGALFKQCETQKLVFEIIAQSIKLLENKTTSKQLVPSLFQMLSVILRLGGEPPKNYFQECSGEELIDLWEASTNQQVRKEATKFAEEFFRASLSNSDATDLFFCQRYH